jgi:hypothetical protein
MKGTEVLKHECPKDECGKATNAAELRMPVERMCKYECLRLLSYFEFFSF